MARLSFLLPLALLCTACNSGSSNIGSSAIPTFHTIDVPGAGTSKYQGTQAIDINAAGEITGYARTSSDYFVAFVLSPTNILTSFEFPSAAHGTLQGTQCFGINSSGTTVCTSPGSEIVAFTRSSTGTLMTFDAPNGGSIVSVTTINDNGDTAGIFTSNLGFRGFVRAGDGTVTPFDTPLGDLNAVSRISNNRLIIGYSNYLSNGSYGFVRAADGTITQFFVPGYETPGYGTVPNDINAGGAIVGSVSTAIGPQGFLRTPDGAVTAIIPPNTAVLGSSAQSINASGVIAGYFSDSFGVYHGYIRSLDGTFTTIDHPNAGKTSGTGTILTRINDAGEVIGTYSDAQGAYHGFVRR